MKLMLVGGTGLVGAQVLALALAEPRVTRVVAPTRRPLAPHPKLENLVVDFDHLDGGAPWWAVDAVVCTLGTTIGQAGSQAAFRKVDLEYPLAVARHAQKAGAGSFVINTAVGADAKSSVFYSRVKGEVEEALEKLTFGSLTLVRPSMLDGGPRPESRPGERVGLWGMRLLWPLIPKRYRAVKTEAVARACLRAALAGEPGVQVIENEAIG